MRNNGYISDKDPKKLAIEMAAHVGKREAIRLLINEGLSPSIAEKLAAGRYAAANVNYLTTLAIVRAHEASKAQAS